MKKCHRDPEPGWGQDQSPDLITPTSDGRHHAVWFRSKAAPKPEQYDYSVPHRGSVNWRVYFLTLCFAMVPLWCVARLIMTAIESAL